MTSAPEDIAPPEGPGLFGDLPESDGGYQVLARKYRPRRFEDLIGQEAMVRTLRNAFASGRIHHAFMLTGVRGVGKTTTARIIARALNFEGPNGEEGPTTDLSVDGVHCAAIANSSHPDVQEMDAASRTGIGEIRDLIDGVRYAPTSARYKVYIIDEVHMLSIQAFNGLLKTLEEPPPHVVFIFATTEIRKVPITVLSRCQRFDLRRVEPEVLVSHLQKISEHEGADITPDALALIAKAAEGSVRDSLSLLDQAIAQGDGLIELEAVRDMLGLADRTQTLDLFEALMGGDIKQALDLLGEQTRSGAEPLAVIQDLAGLTHQTTKAKLSGSVSETEPDAARLLNLGEKLAMPHLARVWQILLKGIGEVQTAPDPIAAAEMLLIRLTHLSALPPPAEIVRKLQGTDTAGQHPPRVNKPASAPPPASGPGSATSAVAMPQKTASAAAPVLQSFEQVIALAEEKGALRLARDLKEEVHIVRFERGHIEFSPGAGAPGDLAGRLGKQLHSWTGERWMVALSDAAGKPTVRSQRLEKERKRKEEAAKDPLVKAILETFPGSDIVEIRERSIDAEAVTDLSADDTDPSTISD